MAKEFKDFDKKYSHLKGKVPPHCSTAMICLAKDIKSWAFRGAWVHPSIEAARWAAYDAANHEEWQRFRVSLKGWSTQEKLMFLEQRWAKYVESSDKDVRKIETIRINNYIGALKRGGALDADLQVVR